MGFFKQMTATELLISLVVCAVFTVVFASFVSNINSTSTYTINTDQLNNLNETTVAMNDVADVVEKASASINVAVKEDNALYIIGYFFKAGYDILKGFVGFITTIPQAMSAAFGSLSFPADDTGALSALKSGAVLIVSILIVIGIFVAVLIGRRI